MNRFELVKKLSSNVEIPNSEGELFLEIFLRKISEEITPDQSVNLPELGSFSYHKSQSGQTRIIFSSDYDMDELSFYLSEERNIPVYQRYNLSLGKPVLPLHERSENPEYVLRPGDNIHMLESKADKLMVSMSKTDVLDKTFLQEEPESDNELMEYSDTDVTLDENLFEEITDSTIEEINEESFADTDEKLSLKENKTVDEFVSNEPEEETISFEDEITDSPIEEISQNTFEEYPEEAIQPEVQSVWDENKNIEDETLLVIEPPEQSGEGLLNDIPEITDELIDTTDELPVHEDFLQPEITSETDKPEIEIIPETESLTEEIHTETMTPEIEDIREIGIPEEPEVSFPDLLGEITHVEPVEGIESVTAENIIEEIPEEIQETETVSQSITEEYQEPELKEEILQNASSDLIEEIPQVTEEDDIPVIIPPVLEEPVIPQEITEDATLGELAEKVIEEVQQTDETDSEMESDKSEDSFIKISGKKKLLDDEENENELPIPDKEDALKQFQRVKSLTREFFNLSDIAQSDNALSWDFGESDQIEKDIKKITKAFDEPEKEAGKRDGYTSVKSRKATYEWSPESVPESVNIDDIDKIALSDEEAAELNLEPSDDIFTSGKPITKTVKISPREQKKGKYFIIVLGIITVLAMAAIAYFNFSDTEIFKTSKAPVEPLIIDREDRVPVMIPGKIEEIKPAEVNESNLQEVQTPAGGMGKGKIEKTENGFYVKNSEYYVQVSSWQSKSKVDREVEKFRGNGYKVEVQTSVVNSEVWYRVLVGGFTSEDAARDFLKNNY